MPNENENCDRDCATCRHGEYSNQWDCLLCFEEDCIDWSKWEEKEEDNNDK